MPRVAIVGGGLAGFFRFLLFTVPALVLIGIPVYLIFLGLRAVLRMTRKPQATQPVETTEKPKAKK